MDDNEGIISIVKDFVSGEFLLRGGLSEGRILCRLIDVYREIQTLYGDVETIWMEQLLQRIQDRMKLGRERYGHGVRVSDDTRQWGTVRNSWAEMCEEEIIDGVIYISANMIRNHPQ